MYRTPAFAAIPFHSAVDVHTRRMLSFSRATTVAAQGRATQAPARRADAAVCVAPPVPTHEARAPPAPLRLIASPPLRPRRSRRARSTSWVAPGDEVATAPGRRRCVPRAVRGTTPALRERLLDQCRMLAACTAHHTPGLAPFRFTPSSPRRRRRQTRSWWRPFARAC